MFNRCLLPFLVGILLASTAAAQTNLGPINLPQQFAALPYDQDFDGLGGTVPPTMAVTRLNAITLQADAQAWCNIGQLAPCISPFDGSNCLEMGLDPGSTNYHDVRNALVIGLDGSGYTGSLSLSYLVADYGDEWDLVDGVWLSNDGVNWWSIADWYSATTVWSDGQPAGLASTPVDVTGQFYLAFVQEDNFPFHDLDGIAIDRIHIPAQLAGKSLGPLNLPAAFTPLPFDEDFEAAAGVVPDYMALSALDAYTLQPSGRAWCNIGQRAVCLDPFKGSYCLELGAEPGGGSGNLVRNALVLGLDGSQYQGQLDLSWFMQNYGDEYNEVDGVWLSEDGSGWFRLRDWTTGQYNLWFDSKPVDLSAIPIDFHTTFYLAFVQEDDFPFADLDGIAIDEIHLPAKWVGIDLGALEVPYGFIVPPWVENFENAGGVVPGYMSTTQLTDLGDPDPEGWCNIGQLGSCSNPYQGSFALEMGLAPGAGWHLGRNALVMAIDPSFTPDASTLSFMVYNAFDESDPVDGVWISDNMADWFQLQDFSSYTYNAWQHSGTLDLSVTTVDTKRPYYLAFVQEDNSAYLASDGIGIDRIAIPALPPPPSLSGPKLTAGTQATLKVKSAPASSPCMFLASTTGSGVSYARDTELDLLPPILRLGNRPTSATGEAELTATVPTSMVGQTLWIQSVVLFDGRGLTSNVIKKRIN